MTQLHEARTQGERTYYEPVLTRIMGTSQYRDDEYRLEGIDGFWSAGKLDLARAVKDGAVAWFTLATKPKTGANARPGSLYRDILTVKPATPEDKEYYASQSHDEDSDSDLPPFAPVGARNGAHSAGNGNVWDERGRQIKLGMAFNNATTRLAALDQLVLNVNVEEGTVSPFDKPDWYDELNAQWWSWFSEASQGRPLTPVDSPLVAEAKRMGAVEEQVELERAIGEAQQAEADPVQQEIEELPW